MQAAAEVAGNQTWPTHTLYMVATPIGNLADFSLRAVHALALADAVACEDTRISGGLLRLLGLEKPLIALHEHNEHTASQKVLERLAQGQRVAYVSDAGTPAISDPGARLVAQARSAGFRALPLPGASAVVTALSAAGDAQAAQAGHSGRAFVFAGFLPAKGSERQAALQAALSEACSTVLFEAPHRIESLAEALAAQCPKRQITVARELTKQFEQFHTLACAELPAWLALDPQHRKGEFVLVLHAQPPAASEEGLPAATEHCLRVLLRDLPLKQAVALAAEICGAPRNALYQQALAWRDEDV